MPKGFTEAEKAAIRQRLVRAGDKLFSAHGLKKTSVDELAAAAKISKGAFYLFYASKEALFMDVAAAAEQRYREEMLAALDRPAPTPRARLLGAFRTGFARLRTTPLLQSAASGDFELLLRRVTSSATNTWSLARCACSCSGGTRRSRQSGCPSLRGRSRSAACSIRWCWPRCTPTTWGRATWSRV
jgi:AcrR family transcriptional regulator